MKLQPIISRKVSFLRNNKKDSLESSIEADSFFILLILFKSTLSELKVLFLEIKRYIINVKMKPNIMAKIDS